MTKVNIGNANVKGKNECSTASIKDTNNGYHQRLASVWRRNSFGRATDRRSNPEVVGSIMYL